MNKKILITGANGFVGRALYCRLAEKYSVRGAVRSKRETFRLPPEIDVVEVGSINHDTDWSKALRGIQTVVHLAARAHVMKESSANPIAEYRRINVAGTERLARMALDAGVRRFIYMSSIGVNGEQTSGKPFTEADYPRPERPYSVSKCEAENYLMRISAKAGLEVVILRPPLVYGPAVKGNMLKLMEYVYRGCPLPLAGINNRRSFIGLRNLVDAIMLSVTRPNAAGQTFLLSDGEDISTTDLIQTIAAAMGKKIILFKLPRPVFKWSSKFFPPVRQKLLQLTGSLVVDSSKFRNMMNWSPQYPLKQGIGEMVSDYISRFQNHGQEII